MLNVTLMLDCDGCNRATEVAIGPVYGRPDFSALLASVEWERFLDGLMLCPECRQNQEIVELGSGNFVSGTTIRAKPAKPFRRVTDEQISTAMAATNNNISKAAELLDCSRVTVHSRCKVLGLESANGHNKKESDNENNVGERFNDAGRNGERSMAGVGS